MVLAVYESDTTYTTVDRRRGLSILACIYGHDGCYRVSGPIRCLFPFGLGYTFCSVFVRAIVLSETYTELTKPSTGAPVNIFTCQTDGCAKICNSRRAYKYVSVALETPESMLTRAANITRPCTKSDVPVRWMTALFVPASQQICGDTTKMSTSSRRILCVLPKVVLDLSVGKIIFGDTIRVRMARDQRSYPTESILRFHLA